MEFSHEGCGVSYRPGLIEGHQQYFVNKSRTVLHGYSPLSAEEILARLQSGDPVAELAGDFVLIWEDNSESEPSVLLASSAISAIPYFYYVSPDRRSLWHGTNIFDCIRQRGLEWQWNDRAVVSLALFQHTLGADTLHPDICR